MATASDDFDVQLGPGMTFAISVYPQPLRLVSVPLARFHELSREFMHLLFFSPASAFISWTKTEGEVSLIVDEATLRQTPELNSTVAQDFGQRWRAMQVHEGADSWGHPIAQTGIVSNLSKPLATAGIAIFYVGTFSSDFILVPEDQLEEAKEALRAATTPTASPALPPSRPPPAAAALLAVDAEEEGPSGEGRRAMGGTSAGKAGEHGRASKEEC